MRLKFKYRIFVVLSIVCSVFSCKKFVEVGVPNNLITSEDAFKNDASATSVVVGIYSDMMRASNLYSSGFTTLLPALSADEMYYYGTSYEEFYLNQITQQSHAIINTLFWQPLYSHIYTANLVIENLSKPNGLSAGTRDLLIGESLFIRAFAYLELVNLFGGVPLVLETNYHKTATQARATTLAIYLQIESDLKSAATLLPEAYVSNGKVRPNKWAAKALLARVALYTGDYAKAAEYSGEVIASAQYSLNNDLNAVFLKNSTESIWQLQPVNPAYNTWEGFLILPTSAASSPTFLLSEQLIQSLDSNDLRKIAWVKSRIWANELISYPYKYKIPGPGMPVTEYYTVLRLAEQYLIRAESRARLNNLADALADLNTVRARAGLLNSPTISQSEILLAIEEERRKELFCEWGHRWFDLKRTGRMEAVLQPIKQYWQNTDSLWPIPVPQLKLNPFLTQNPGY